MAFYTVFHTAEARMEELQKLSLADLNSEWVRCLAGTSQYTIDEIEDEIVRRRAISQAEDDKNAENH
jgi:hypothetical protein